MAKIQTSVRFDSEKMDFVKEKLGLVSPQKVLNYFLDTYWWSNKLLGNPVMERNLAPPENTVPINWPKESHEKAKEKIIKQFSEPPEISAEPPPEITNTTEEENLRQQIEAYEKEIPTLSGQFGKQREKLLQNKIWELRKQLLKIPTDTKKETP